MGGGGGGGGGRGLRGRPAIVQSSQHKLPAQRPSNSKLRFGTRVGKLHRKQTTSHIHTLHRRRQTVLSANPLEGRFGFSDS
jgi:hypothetical protein